MAKERDYKFDGQHDDEEVLMVFRRHPVVMRKGLIAILIGLLLGMIPSLFDATNLKLLWFVPLGFALGMLIFFFYWISWYFSVFIVSDQRFVQITQKGLFNRSVVDVGLDKIQNVNFQIAGIQETLLGFGTILIQTFVGDLILDKIHHPAKVQERIIKIIKELGYSSYGTQTEITSEED